MGSKKFNKRFKIIVYIVAIASFVMFNYNLFTERNFESAVRFATTFPIVLFFVMLANLTDIKDFTLYKRVIMLVLAVSFFVLSIIMYISPDVPQYGKPQLVASSASLLAVMFVSLFPRL